MNCFLLSNALYIFIPWVTNYRSLKLHIVLYHAHVCYVMPIIRPELKTNVEFQFTKRKFLVLWNNLAIDCFLVSCVAPMVKLLQLHLCIDNNQSIDQYSEYWSIARLKLLICFSSEANFFSKWIKLFEDILQLYPRHCFPTNFFLRRNFNLNLKKSC